MNTIDEIALRVAEKLEPRGRTYSPDHYIEFASALLAELSKESKPHCWKCEATIAEQATEISKLIAAVADHVTVRAEQRQKITEQATEIAKCRQIDANVLVSLDKEINELRQQLAAEQAYAEQLREELDRLCSVLNDSGYTTEHSRKIIAIPHDTNALQEYGAKLVERIAEHLSLGEHQEYFGDDVNGALSGIADKIRKGEF